MPEISAQETGYGVEDAGGAHSPEADAGIAICDPLGFPRDSGVPARAAEGFP